MCHHHYYYYFIFLLLLSNFTLHSVRSVHRPQDPYIPEITTYWNAQSPHYTIKNYHLKEYPTFKINIEKLTPYALPDTPIIFTRPININKIESVNGKLLKEQLETLVQEIYAHKKSFTHFTILRKKDFNFDKKCGLIIVKYKKYPFVVKLSIEKPETFVNPYCKGIIPMYFFFMAGGSNRHMTGLTRILNLHQTNKALSLHPLWSHHVKTPRKWFWLPEKVSYFTIQGKNIGKEKKTITTSLPSIYAVVADAIDTQNKLPIAKKIKNKIIIKLCNDLNLMVDPHEDNFIFQCDPITKKIIIIIVDTEHFPTMVGVHKTQKFTGYTDFYFSLGFKAACDMFFLTKNQRFLLQNDLYTQALLL